MVAYFLKNVNVIVNIATLIAVCVGFYQVNQSARSNQLSSASLSYALVDQFNSSAMQSHIVDSNIDFIALSLSKEKGRSLINYIGDIEPLLRFVSGLNFCVRNNHCDKKLLQSYFVPFLSTLCEAIVIVEAEFYRRRDLQVQRKSNAREKYDDANDSYVDPLSSYEFFTAFYENKFLEARNTIAELYPECIDLAVTDTYTPDFLDFGSPSSEKLPFTPPEPDDNDG